MGMLTEIFKPIADTNDPVLLDSINVIAFDTDGTLVHKNKDCAHHQRYVADLDVTRLLSDLQKNKDRLNLAEVVVISGSPALADEALKEAKIDAIIPRPVEDRQAFYARMHNAGKRVLVIDDDFLLGMLADAHVDPHAEHVREYLSSKQYRNELK